jgi:cold shock CspA family protein
MTQPRHEGTLKKWNDQRGFGFIAPSDGGADLFVHITAFPSDGYLPTQGEVLTFEVEPDRSGRPSAVRVQRTGAPANEVAQTAGRGRKPHMSRSPGHAPSSRSQRLIVLVLLVVLAVFAYNRYAKRVGQIGAVGHRTVQSPVP